MELVIAVDDPRAADVRALLETHLAFARSVTPPEGVFALDIDGLLDPFVTFVSARRDGVVVGVGALKELDASHGELKSMHTVAAARRQGVGQALARHLLSLAAERGYARVSLETGTEDAFVPAREFYASLGFVACDRFGPYVNSPTSACMAIQLTAS